jgi:predicted HTH transcriptional regulator
MKMDEKTIKEALLKGERVTLECKRAKAEVPKIIAAWKGTNWGEPQLLNRLDVDEVELVLPVPSTKSSGAGVSEGVSNRVPNGVSDTAPANAPANAPVNAPVKLSKTQSAIIKVLLKDNRATYEDLARTIGVDRTTIRRNIAVLKEKGVIRRVGEDKNGYWEVLISIENVV